MELQNLLGFLLPPVIDLINQRVADARLRFLVSMLICLIAGTILNLDKLSDPKLFLGSVALVFAAAQTTYNTYWKQSDMRANLIGK